MKKTLVRWAAIVAGLLVGGVAVAQLAGTQKISDNFWFSGGRAIKFGPGPDITESFSSPNMTWNAITGDGFVFKVNGTTKATINASGITGAIVGNASTATALAANGANCSAGNFAQGVDAIGAAEGCATAVTSVASGTGITGGTITGTGTLSFDYSTTLATNSLTAGQCVLDSGDAQGGLLCEGATANTNQTLLTVTEPTADRTITFPDASGVPILSSSAPGAANAISGASAGIVFEGSTADAVTTTLAVADPTSSSKTITLPNATGTACVGGNITVTAGANTACTTTCGAGKCIAGQDTDGATKPLVACSNAIADLCICSN